MTTAETDPRAAVFPPPDLPPLRRVHLPGRGTTAVREVEGPEGAPVLVLLHGWTANAALNWFSSYTALGRHFRVVAIDHRGHGQGIRSRRRFRLEDCADDVVALADVLGIDRFIPVGYSMGGPIAQLIWHRHRPRVEGLVLCATSRNFTSRLPGERAVRGVVTGLGFAARATPVPLRRQLHERVLVARYDDTPLGRWARGEARANDLRMLIEAGQAIGTFSSKTWIGGVDVPSAVVLTEADNVVPPHRQRRLAAAIPGATVHPVAGAHDVCAVEPDLFVPALLAACTDVAARVRPAS